MNKQYTISEQANVQILSPTSLLDEWENRQILKDLQDYINAGYDQFIVDLSNLQLINSVGINFLLTFLSRLQNVGGQLIVANVNTFVLSLLEKTRLTSVFELQASLDVAVDQLAQEKVFA